MTADELRDMCAVHGHVEVLSFDSRRYVGAQIGIHNPKGERVGTVSHVRNQEYLAIAGDRREVARWSTRPGRSKPMPDDTAAPVELAKVDDCDLCEAARITPWFHEDDVCWIAECEICYVPMVVWRFHGTEPPPEHLAHMHAQLGRVAGETLTVEHYVDDNMRNIPDHYHAHAPEGGSSGTATGSDRAWLPGRSVPIGPGVEYGRRGGMDCARSGLAQSLGRRE